jgi:hypothetical protein
MATISPQNQQSKGEQQYYGITTTQQQQSKETTPLLWHQQPLPQQQGKKKKGENFKTKGDCEKHLPNLLVNPIHTSVHKYGIPFPWK